MLISVAPMKGLCSDWKGPIVIWERHNEQAHCEKDFGLVMLSSTGLDVPERGTNTCLAADV